MIADDVYRLVKQIPKGKVSSYGAIAKKLMISPRQVGRILHNNPDNSIIPCHRVVHTDGTLANGFAFGGPAGQRKLLMAEGVRFRKGKVVPG